MHEGSRWFAGTDGRDDAQERFLLELRERAQHWDVDGLVPEEHTLAHEWAVPLAVVVEVPGLEDSWRDVLEVVYDTCHRAGPTLSGTWGASGTPLDGPGGDESEDLRVTGVVARDEQFAGWAADWLVRQLRRPVARHDWLRSGGVDASTWLLDDAGRVLSKTGFSFRRWLRRPPDQRTALRPGDPAG